MKSISNGRLLFASHRTFVRAFFVTCWVAAAGCVSAAPQTSASEGTEGESTPAGYSTSLLVNPSPVAIGTPTQLEIGITDPNRTPVTQFDLSHTQAMHLIAVSADLEDFIHVHPTLNSSGRLLATATFARAQSYGLFLEYDPAGPTGEVLSRRELTPANAAPASPNLVEGESFDGSVSKKIVNGDTELEFVGSAETIIRTSASSHIVVRLRKTDGSTVDDLVPWLGMPAHGIVLSPDRKTFIHAHGRIEGATDSSHTQHGVSGTDTTVLPGGPIAIDATLPTAGLYKLFVQFQRGTKVITTSIVLRASSEAATPTPQPKTCATTKCPEGQECMVMGTPPAPMCM